MNNLIYGNQQPDKLAAGVEEIVRKDLGSPASLPYTSATTDAREVMAIAAAVQAAL